MIEESKSDIICEQTSKQSVEMNEETKTIYRQMQPQRNTFTFTGKGGIIISSDFDSGNLSTCEETQELTSLAAETQSQLSEESKDNLSE